MSQHVTAAPTLLKVSEEFEDDCLIGSDCVRQL